MAVTIGIGGGSLLISGVRNADIGRVLEGLSLVCLAVFYYFHWTAGFWRTPTWARIITATGIVLLIAAAIISRGEP